jgi:soluble lytic murein transglycosylase-like protein
MRPVVSTTPTLTRAPAASTEPWRSLVAKYWPANQVDNALAVMRQESGGNPTQHNNNPATGDDSWGLYQINRYGSLAKGRPLPDWLATPENNIAYAADMYRAQGWEPWHNSATKLGLLQ